jgi:hypothetical protein
MGQFSVSWMYDTGPAALLTASGPVTLESNLRSPLEIFISDAAAAATGDAEPRAREGAGHARPAPAAERA